MAEGTDAELEAEFGAEFCRELSHAFVRQLFWKPSRKKCSQWSAQEISSSSSVGASTRPNSNPAGQIQHNLFWRPSHFRRRSSSEPRNQRIPDQQTEADDIPNSITSRNGPISSESHTRTFSSTSHPSPTVSEVSSTASQPNRSPQCESDTLSSTSSSIDLNPKTKKYSNNSKNRFCTSQKRILVKETCPFSSSSAAAETESDDEFGPIEVKKRKAAAAVSAETESDSDDVPPPAPPPLSPDELTFKVANNRARHSYTMDEDFRILQHIVKNRRWADTTGNLLWKEMEVTPFDHARTWQSLRERFLKRIRPNLDSYAAKFNIQATTLARLKLGSKGGRPIRPQTIGPQTIEVDDQPEEEEEPTEVADSAAEDARPNIDITAEDNAIVHFVLASSHQLLSKHLWLDLLRHLQANERPSDDDDERHQEECSDRRASSWPYLKDWEAVRARYVTHILRHLEQFSMLDRQQSLALLNKSAILLTVKERARVRRKLRERFGRNTSFNMS